MSDNHNNEPDKKNKIIAYEVDEEAQETDQKVLTPTQILTKAGIDPQTNYLVQLEGNEQKSYKDKPDEQIHMHNGMRFISRYTGPVKVS